MRPSHESHKQLISESGLSINATTRVFVFDETPSVIVTKYACQPRLGLLYKLHDVSGQLLAYHTLESQRGKGYATSALVETIKHSHVALYASIYLTNTASISVAKKAGMKEIARGQWKGDVVVLFRA